MIQLGASLQMSHRWLVSKKSLFFLTAPFADSSGRLQIKSESGYGAFCCLLQMAIRIVNPVVAGSSPAATARFLAEIYTAGSGDN
jgi:hypothetical protein